MRKFDSIEDFLVFCKNNKKFCEKNKKQMADIASAIYLTKAGYTNLEGVNVSEIYKELEHLSFANAIRGGNKDYLSVKNEDIMNSVIAAGSDELKRFLRNNGHIIVDLVKRPRLVPLRQKEDADTMLIGSPQVKNLQRARSDSGGNLLRMMRNLRPTKSVTSSIASKSTIGD